MHIEALKLSPLALEALQALRIQVELNEKSHLRCKNTDELVQVIEIALRSSHASIKQCLHKLLAEFNPQQVAFFKSTGVDLEKASQQRVIKKSYRGIETQSTHSAEAPHTTEANSTTGKRKVIYRGQVKWV